MNAVEVHCSVVQLLIPFFFMGVGYIIQSIISLCRNCTVLNIFRMRFVFPLIQLYVVMRVITLFFVFVHI